MPGATAAGVAGATAAGFTAGTVAFTVASTVISLSITIGASLALGAVSKALSGKPSGGGLGALQNRTSTIKQPITPHRIIYGKVRVGGALTFLTTTINDGLFHMVTTIAGHEINSFQQYFFNDEELILRANGHPDSGSWNGTGNNPRARVIGALGTTAGDADFNTALQANTTLWTADHKQTGLAKVYVEGATNNFLNGLPNATFVVEGKKILDSRTSTTAYSNNAALVIRDYLTDTRLGLGEPSSRINDTAFNAAANICDENVNLNPSGTEKRYTINGTIDTDEEPLSILQRLLSACAGTLTYQGGQWNLYVGAYRTPTITFNEDVLDGPIRIQTKVGRKEIFNRVKGVYVEPSDLYQPTDFPAITNSTYLSEDNLEEIWKDVEFIHTTSSATAQRLAKIELEKARQQITVNYPVNLEGMRVQVGDVINIDNTRMGWSGKPFEIKEWTFATRGGGDSPRLGIDLVLRETASTVYDWNSGEETTVDPAPNTNLPNPFVVGQPGVPSVIETLFSARDGAGVKARVTIAWSTAEDTFVNKYLVEHKLTTETEWVPQPTTQKLTLNIDDIAPGTYDFRVTAINKFEFESTPQSVSKEVLGLATPPEDITGLSISPISGLAVLSWDIVDDLDVREGGKIVFRHSSALTGATWGASVSIGQSVAGTTNTAVLPLLEGTYLVKAQDSSGIFSTGVAVISTKSPSLFVFTNLSTLSFHPTFTGTLTDTIVETSKLKLTGTSNVDDYGTVDSITDWDGEGGLATLGTAVFTTGIDLSSVKTVRVTADITTATVNIDDLIDNRSSLIDAWQTVDGDALGQGDVQIFVRETDDDPTGSPTWEPWKVLTLSELKARAFEFKVELTTTDPTYNIEISALTVKVDEVA